MKTALFTTPRPEPGHLVPALGGGVVVLVAAAVASPHLAVAAAVTYALAYTFELGLSLATYFGAVK